MAERALVIKIYEPENGLKLRSSFKLNLYLFFKIEYINKYDKDKEEINIIPKIGILIFKNNVNKTLNRIKSIRYAR